MATSWGTVKWFNDKRGFGFITSDEFPGKDIFVHYSQIESDNTGWSTLKQNQTVCFECIDTKKGLAAKNVRPM